MQTVAEPRRDRPQHRRVGDEVVVALARFLGIGGLDDATEIDGELNEGAHVLHALRLISVEQTVRGRSADHVAQLPCQIGDIA